MKKDKHRIEITWRNTLEAKKEIKDESYNPALAAYKLGYEFYIESGAVWKIEDHADYHREVKTEFVVEDVGQKTWWSEEARNLYEKAEWSFNGEKRETKLDALGDYDDLYCLFLHFDPHNTEAQEFVEICREAFGGMYWHCIDLNKQRKEDLEKLKAEVGF